MTPALQALHEGRGERQHALDTALRPVGVHDLVLHVAGLTAGVDAPRGFVELLLVTVVGVVAVQLLLLVAVLLLLLVDVVVEEHVEEEE